MYLCYERHDEIVHEGKNCPVCEIVLELDEAKNEIERLEGRIRELE